VFIKNTKRNWGSCSEKGNLNFNYKLALLPRELAAYVVVHELCHLAVFDHSQTFWDLVSREMPDHKALRKAMRKYHA
jgi:predicted metal-dependent hydrolase